MQAFPSAAAKTLAQYLLRLTPYDMMRSSHDFEDVKATLNERTTWTIEVLRSVFAIRFANGGYFITLCSLLFLLMAETTHLYYGRLSPLELKERVENMGHATFAILITIPDLGIIIVRVAAILTASPSLALAALLIFLSAAPSFVLPLLMHTIRRPTAEPGEGEGGIRVET
ncbi:hypothetical protein PAXRUDRAFT_835971 [Paxillus rubicundulus Ve08.2h10]|uniref:Uncharacterized protein n=1 Tax=Paxillus rubicundulus Ve08.2h10 TaxID=930991 RepID=A0A0D0DB83_9AGAM|nr:hypothetical protein PAXRUDRAFT_835971 [Paxillus rubicundulus Ve08.2h10]